MKTILSKDNASIKKWNSLHLKKNRDMMGLFLVEGEHMVSEALQENCIETIITDTGSPFDFENTVNVTPEIMRKLSSSSSSAHFIAVCRKTEKEPEKKQRLLLLDEIQDPGNLGTLIRTATSFSFDAIYCSKGACDVYNDKVLRSTQGAVFHIPFIRTDLEQLTKQLQKEHVKVIATSLKNAEPMQNIQAEEKMAFVLGNEGQGVSSQLLKAADARLRIEMQGFESLNVAVAGGIIMYHYSLRQ